MKKNLVLYTIVLILAGTTGYILLKKAGKSTLDGESGEFRYNDTAAITKIHILEKNGSEATLERKGNVWMINDKYPAKKRNVDLLLYTLKQIHVRFPVSEKLMNTVVQEIATGGKKVEFYAGDEIVKKWYIGGTTQSHTGTYMVLGYNDSDEKYETAYATYIPGFEGFLNTRFYTNLNEWKSTTLVHTTPPEIASVKVEHTGMPDSSFIIKVNGVNNFTLTDLNNNVIPSPDTFAIKQYLVYSSILDVTDYLTGISTPQIDSVKRSIPFTTITIRLKNGTEQKMKLFTKKPEPNTMDEELGVKLLKDPNYAYILFNNDQEFGLVQYLMFGKLIQSRRYFLQPAFVKK